MAEKEQSIGDKVARGAIWTVSMRLIVRLLGLVNVAVYARVLTKAEVGLVVLLISLTAILQLLLDTIVRISLVRIQKLRNEHYGAAFKLRFWCGILAGGLIAALAEPTASFYGEEVLGAGLYILGFALALEGIATSWVISFQRELQYQKDFIFETIVGVGRILITIALVLWLRSLWAIVWGILAAAVIRVVLSHIMCWGRSLKSDRAALGDVWDISKWAGVEALATFSEERIDRISLAKIGTAGQLAVFSQALDLVLLPIGNLIMPIGRAFLPGLHKLREQSKELIAEIYAKAVGAMIALCFPVAFGLALVAEPLALTLFGDNWPELIFALQLAAPFALGEGIYASSKQIYMAEGYLRQLSILQWVRVVFFIPMVLGGYFLFGLYGAIAAKSFTSLMLLIPVLWFLAKHVEVRWRIALMQVLRSLLACIVMSIVYLAMAHMLFPSLPESWLQLIVGVVVGGGSYGVALYIIWFAARKPEGLEHKVFAMLKLA
ncbi:oligosaccharide flippase family protein [Kordiimonas laminariae]|uniref:oligosaccharide flippase family protein n=1 Tax=Kordiimonas laminariae TaxID=2917717 RepID=UPI001FF216D1|nr:oligosaccharide flippase family protein [Kordiimonas laminariae]MCK0069645.1 oligosaccharide flippase family protein [Kordiimonas laminariae]